MCTSGGGARARAYSASIGDMLTSESKNDKNWRDGDPGNILYSLQGYHNS